jgi:hypothetical protein
MVPLKESVLMILSFSSGCRDAHTDYLKRVTFDVLGTVVFISLNYTLSRVILLYTLSHFIRKRNQSWTDPEGSRMLRIPDF